MKREKKDNRIGKGERERDGATMCFGKVGDLVLTSRLHHGCLIMATANIQSKHMNPVLLLWIVSAGLIFCSDTFRVRDFSLRVLSFIIVIACEFSKNRLFYCRTFFFRGTRRVLCRSGMNFAGFRGNCRSGQDRGAIFSVPYTSACDLLLA